MLKYKKLVKIEKVQKVPKWSRPLSGATKVPGGAQNVNDSHDHQIFKKFDRPSTKMTTMSSDFSDFDGLQRLLKHVESASRRTKIPKIKKKF